VEGDQYIPIEQRFVCCLRESDGPKLERETPIGIACNGHVLYPNLIRFREEQGSNLPIISEG